MTEDPYQNHQMNVRVVAHHTVLSSGLYLAYTMWIARRTSCSKAEEGIVAEDAERSCTRGIRLRLPFQVGH